MGRAVGEVDRLFFRTDLVDSSPSEGGGEEKVRKEGEEDTGCPSATSSLAIANAFVALERIACALRVGSSVDCMLVEGASSD